jgi:hypothetical protein
VVQAAEHRFGDDTVTTTDHVLRHAGLSDVNPSFRSSPWIRGAPQSEFAADIVRINAGRRLTLLVDPSGDDSSTSRTDESLADARR